MFFYVASSSVRLFFFCLIAALFFLQSCISVVKNPPSRPFVYQTNIEIEGKFSTDEKKRLTSQLEQQLHDSIRVRKVQSWILWETLKNPPVYDTLNVGKSEVYMKALLNSLGYYRDTIEYNADIDTVNTTQYRTTVNFKVRPGKLTRLDSVWYSMDRKDTSNLPGSDTLQQITLQSLKESFLKKKNHSVNL